MSFSSLPIIVLLVVIAVIAFSGMINWRKKAALKPNLAAVRHETEGEILKEHEKEHKKRKEEN
ncbi:MAG: hypothetical protein ACOX4H_10665 [Bacillota bacterium]|jgi:hypothetical protein|nr:hypothetical protein [Clostridia bacterium]